jgi:hypothetical protein
VDPAFAEVILKNIERLMASTRSDSNWGVYYTASIWITEVTHHQFTAEWTRPIRSAFHVLMSTRTETNSGQCQTDFA